MKQQTFSDLFGTNYRFFPFKYIITIDGKIYINTNLTYFDSIVKKYSIPLEKITKAGEIQFSPRTIGDRDADKVLHLNYHEYKHEGTGELGNSVNRADSNDLLKIYDAFESQDTGIKFYDYKFDAIIRYVNHERTELVTENKSLEQNLEIKKPFKPFSIN